MIAVDEAWVIYVLQNGYHHHSLVVNYNKYQIEIAYGLNKSFISIVKVRSHTVSVIRVRARSGELDATAIA